MAIRAVILDFDGVINDSSSLKRVSKRLIKIINDSGYKIPCDINEKLKQNWGLHGIKLIETCFGLNLKVAEEIYQEWERIDKAKPFPLIEGTKQVLRKIQSKQLPLILLTSRHRKNLMDLMRYFNLVKFFEFIQAKEDWKFVKPDPHTFCFVLHRLGKSGICAEECLYVGDAILDFECATQRGIQSISVLTGVFDRPDFLKAGQKKENILRSIADLPQWIEKYKDC